MAAAPWVEEHTADTAAAAGEPHRAVGVVEAGRFPPVAYSAAYSAAAGLVPLVPLQLEDAVAVVEEPQE